MRKLFVFALASAGAAIGGCSLFGWEGFSGGDDDNPGNEEAGGPGSDSSSDGGGGTNDGAPNDSAPSGPFCKTTGASASFCDDFEEPGTFTGKWSEQDQYLGTIEVKDNIGFAGTRGLQFSATPVAGGQNGRIMLGWTTPSEATSIDAELAVKLTSLPPTGYLAGPLYVQLDAYSGGYARLGFNLDGAGVLTTNPVVFPPDAEAVSSGSKPITTLAVGTWTRIRIVSDLQKGTIAAYVDGSLKHEQMILGFAPSKVTVRIGAHYVGTEDGGTFGMDLDDARVSWK